jgi:23S rRNA (uracil1939-C5)-methyltransferase
MIDSYSHVGEGVGRINGKAVFIPDALRGELVSFKLIEEKKSYARGQLIEVLTPSAERLTPPCPSYRECGGCQLQQMSYQEQLHFKGDQVRASLERIGGLHGLTVQPVLGMEYAEGYRHTARFHLSLNSRQIRAGFHGLKSHSLADASCCRLLPPEFPRLLAMVVELLEQSWDLQRYPVSEIVLRKGLKSGELLAVLHADRLPPELAPSQLITGICRSVPRCVGVAAVAKSRTSAANNGRHRRSGQTNSQDRDLIVLYGRDYYLEEVCGTRFRVPAAAFFQNNPRQAEALVQIVRSCCRPRKDDTLLDLYCGVGLFSLNLAQAVSYIYGIEEKEAATEAAGENSLNNGIKNASFHTGKVEKLLPQLRNGTFRPDTVLLDPPRTGCSAEALQGILQLAPQKIIYVSCNPATLARDLRRLTAEIYQVDLVQPVDMFPQTFHVECVVLMSRSGATQTSTDTTHAIAVQEAEPHGEG